MDNGSVMSAVKLSNTETDWQASGSDVINLTRTLNLPSYNLVNNSSL